MIFGYLRSHGYIAFSILFVSVRYVLLFLEHNAGNGVMVNCTLHVWHQTEQEKNLSQFHDAKKYKAQKDIQEAIQLTTLDYGYDAVRGDVRRQIPNPVIDCILYVTM